MAGLSQEELILQTVFEEKPELLRTSKKIRLLCKGDRLLVTTGRHACLQGRNILWALCKTPTGAIEELEFAEAYFIDTQDAVWEDFSSVFKRKILNFFRLHNPHLLKIARGILWLIQHKVEG